jgi:hypothetical protein
MQLNGGLLPAKEKTFKLSIGAVNISLAHIPIFAPIME